MDMPVAPATAPTNRATPASELLQDLLATFTAERVSVGELLVHLESRAVGLILLLLALPMCIPNLPGISTVFGVLMAAPAMQLILGRGRVWLPKGVRNTTFERETLRKAIAAAVPVLKRIEALLRPRLCFMTAPPFTIFFGLQVLVMAFVLTLPIAGGNWPPGISVAILALALLQRDGVAAILSTIASIASLAFIITLYAVGAKLFWDLGRFYFG
jgi:hypothetical protein